MSNTINKSASRQGENLVAAFTPTPILIRDKKRAVEGSDERVAQTGGCLLCLLTARIIVCVVAWHVVL